MQVDGGSVICVVKTHEADSYPGFRFLFGGGRCLPGEACTRDSHQVLRCIRDRRSFVPGDPEGAPPPPVQHFLSARSFTCCRASHSSSSHLDRDLSFSLLSTDYRHLHLHLLTLIYSSFQQFGSY